MKHIKFKAKTKIQIKLLQRTRKKKREKNEIRQGERKVRCTHSPGKQKKNMKIRRTTKCKQWGKIPQGNIY